MERLRALPGVQLVGLVENIPFNEGTAATRFRRGDRQTDAGPLLQYTFAAGDYFKAMGIRQLAGRPFDSNDHFTAAANVVISRSAADLLWPGESALGRRLRPERLAATFTVVGVVDDVMQYDFREAALPLVYFPLVGPTPHEWVISSPAYVVKTPRAEHDRAGDPCARARDGARWRRCIASTRWPDSQRDSMVDLSFTMLTLAIASVAGARPGRRRALRRAVVRRRRAHARDRRAHGAWRAQRSRCAGWSSLQGARVVVAGVALGAVVAALLDRRARQPALRACGRWTRRRSRRCRRRCSRSGLSQATCLLAARRRSIPSSRCAATETGAVLLPPHSGGRHPSGRRQGGFEIVFLEEAVQGGKIVGPVHYR